MARSDAVWGIDIGQCALKALRCRPGAEPNQVTAEAFDYIEYPKILSQPEADPVALVQDALKEFLSRNSLRGDKVAISVPGQSGLARFIKLPPVESRKIPDIVKYEARQQIPFSLDDVVWDYQKMVGGSEAEGFSLETEVGLFAMKRDQVYRALKPFTDAGIEVDFVQLTPLAIYNFAAFDQMPDLPPESEYDPESPPPSIVLLSLGTDSTDLVVTNGYRVWQRSVPIGGNHFTKALTKELKLTFATAEHLKRNAAKAEDPKALFQAMRPVFNDLLTEVQRSIGYFSNLDRRAKISRVLALGNAMKLPGLQRYLAQNLGYEFSRVESYRALTGAAVVDAPAFKENVLSFSVCYGLALQGLREAKIKTNLLPRELIKDRMIRAKKPWAVGAAAALLLGCTISYLGHWRAWNSYRIDNYFGTAVKAADDVVKTARGYESDFTKAKDEYKKTSEVGQGLIPSKERRERWLEVWKALNLCLPHDEGQPPADITLRNMLNITSIQAEHVDDVAPWYTAVQEFDKREVVAPPPAAAAPPAEGTEGAEGAEAAAPPPPAEAPAEAAADTGPTGAGWIIEMRGYHFHNKKATPSNSGAWFVRKTLIKNLLAGKVALPPADQQPGGPTEIDMKKLGLAYPVVIPVSGARDYDAGMDWSFKFNKSGDDDSPAEGADAAKSNVVDAPKFDFIVQLVWLEEPPVEKEPEGAEAGAEGAMPAETPAATPAAAPVAPTEENAPAPAEGDQPKEEAPAQPADAPPPSETPANETPPAEGAAAAPPAAPGGAAPGAEVPPEGAPVEGAPPAAPQPTPPAAPANP